VVKALEKPNNFVMIYHSWKANEIGKKQGHINGCNHMGLRWLAYNQK